MLIVLAESLCAQLTRSALFIGNSYIYTNDLPTMAAEVAASMGDTLIHDQSTPGGYSFSLHLSNATTVSKIEEGNWDYVILQEQSQIPSFPIEQVETDCFPYAAQLCDMIELNNPCAQSMFFMTWGREEGDSQNCANWPPVCTYEGMDDLLHERYLMMAEQNNAVVSPVGAVWRFIRENNDQISLYSPDQSHPSLTGSYAAAVCFYTAIFRKNPELIPYNGGISETDAEYIRSAVKQVVFDHFEDWYIGNNDPMADLNWNAINAFDFQFSAVTANGEITGISFEENEWTTWNGEELIHTFPGNGLFSVGVIAGSCDISDTTYYDIQVGPVGLHELNETFRIFPNPVKEKFYFVSDSGEERSHRIEVLDSFGKTVRVFNSWQPITQSYDVSDLMNGCYVIRIISGTHTVFQKVIIAK